MHVHNVNGIQSKMLAANVPDTLFSFPYGVMQVDYERLREAVMECFLKGKVP